MKKMNFLKIAFTLVLAISFSVAFGQVMDANLTVDQTVDQYVTVDKALPYFVDPNDYFNPNYDGSNVLASTFLWSFSTTAVGATPVFSSTSVINPDITLDVVGDYVLDVVETSADGCAGSTRQLNIHVLAAPICDFGGRANVEFCQDAVARDVLFDIADNTATLFRVDYTVTVDEMLADKTTFSANVSGPTATNDVAYAAPNTGLVLASQVFTASNNKVTRYTFTLTGINDAVSRVSDYIAPLGRNIAATNFTNYAAGADNTFEVLVLPAPVTGPIYHIAN